jgi:hypothetical protein
MRKIILFAWAYMGQSPFDEVCFAEWALSDCQFTAAPKSVGNCDVFIHEFYGK